jgi:hypothetical protein
MDSVKLTIYSIKNNKQKLLFVNLINDQFYEKKGWHTLPMVFIEF